MQQSLKRFEKPQLENFETALKEIKQGKKTSHWMWYIFPQLKGLGLSETSKYYAIENLGEAHLFLNDPFLGKNLLTITTALLNLDTTDAYAVFGSPDNQKLHSCMTLFALIENTDPVFEKVLSKYFDGKKDSATLHLLEV